MALKELLQAADWKAEKHVPVIEAPDRVTKAEPAVISVCVGKQIPHPNTTEHHIAWIGMYFLPKGEKFPYQVGRFEFASHGASTQGPNTSTVYTQPTVKVELKTEKPGTIIATAYCNIHGLWENSKEIAVA